ncbi:MAG: DNA translocase FtsK 4TM domain-containing protein, partial [Opitutales bacterium]|nr:DNA translocase FtsK 4TM domain-containing protein [Opitutales bacterium]
MPAPARKRSATLARPASESKPILAVVLALIGAFLLVAMLFHAPSDQNLIPEWLEKTFSLPAESNAKAEHNPCGAFGATVAVILFSLFGYAGFFVPFFLFAAAWFALNQRAHTLWPVKVTLMAVCVILFAPILTLWLGTAKDVAVAFDPRGPGGVLGTMLYSSVFHPVLGDYGTWILVFPYGFCLLGALADDPKATLSSWSAEMRDGFGAWNAERKAAAVTAAEEQRRRAATAAELRRKQQEVVGAAIAVPQPKETAKPASKSVLVEVDTPHEGPEDDEDVGPELVDSDNVSISTDTAPK